MKTDYLFVVTLKEMMFTTPVSDITVSLLCEKLNINRKTFYYHYHDIFDLMVQTYLLEKIPNIETVNNIEELIHTIYKYYEDNRGFVDSTINSIGQNLFLEFIVNNCYKVFLRLITNIDTKTELDITDKRNMSMYYAGAFAHVIQYYLITHQNKSEYQLLKCFDIISDNDFKNSLLRLIDKKKEAKK